MCVPIEGARDPAARLASTAARSMVVVEPRLVTERAADRDEPIAELGARALVPGAVAEIRSRRRHDAAQRTLARLAP